LQSRLRDTELRFQISDARARLLAARVDLYSLNFGAATENLEAAKIPIQAVIQRYERDGESVRLTEAQGALAAVEDARRRAAKLDASAQTTCRRKLARRLQPFRPPVRFARSPSWNATTLARRCVRLGAIGPKRHNDWASAPQRCTGNSSRNGDNAVISIRQTRRPDSNRASAHPAPPMR
jgi:hypothetical protein